MQQEPTEPSIRLPRYRRHRYRRLPFVLQERDRAIVRLVADYRLLGSGELQALTPGSPQAILRRLQRLYHAGYLERPPDQRFLGNGRMIYALGARGAQLLAAEGRHVVCDAEQTRTIGAYFLEHALMISRVHTVLTLATLQRADVVLDAWRQDRDLWDRVTVSRRGNDEMIPVCPDAYFILRLLNEPDGRNRVHVFVECDRSTMTTKRFATKIRGYFHYRQSGRQTERFGIKNFLVVTVTKSPERAANLIAATRTVKEAAGFQRMFLFGCERNFTLQAPQNILEAIWATPADEGRHSLLE